MSVALDALKIVPDFISKGSGGLSYVSDQITYPADLTSVPDDAYNKTGSAVWLGKSSDLMGEESVFFGLYGQFRQFEETIINDPDSRIMPVLANVYFDLTKVMEEMSSKSELSISFKALEKPFVQTPEDPRIRFVCEGHYDPALSGDVRFRAVLEIDQNANVNVLELGVTDGDAILTDNSPNGFSVSFERSTF